MLYNEPIIPQRAKESTSLGIKAVMGWSSEITGTSVAQGAVT